MTKVQSIGTEQAIALYATEWWLLVDYEAQARFQLFTEELCMPFDLFQRAVEKQLGRSVWTHEFAWPSLLRAELLGARPAPTFAEISSLLAFKEPVWQQQ